MSIAYQDSVGWKAVNLEALDPQLSQWTGLDWIHFTENAVQSKEPNPIGQVILQQNLMKFISGEELATDYRETICQTETLCDPTQGQVRHSVRASGLIAEIIQRDESRCDIYITATSDFHGEWKMKHKKLTIHGYRCMHPTVSGDGKYVAFLAWKVPPKPTTDSTKLYPDLSVQSDRETPYLVIYEIGVADDKVRSILQTNQTDLEAVEFDGRKYSRLYPQLPGSTLPSLYSYYMDQSKK